MVSKIITSFLVVFVYQAFTINVAAQQFFNVDELVGKYSIGDGLINDSIEINPDGTYAKNHVSCTYATQQTGKLDSVNGTLHFTLLKFVGKKFANEKKEFNLLNSNNRKKFYDDEEDEPIPTEYEFQPVRWGERIYLIDKDILQDFSNAINLGFEPRTGSDIGLYYGPFFLRKGDENKTVHEKPLLPQEWQSFLLDRPVTTNVLSIEEKGKVKIATIDKGSQDGLRVGMKLARKDDMPEIWSEEGVIISVENHTSKIRTYKFEIGDILSTRFNFRNE